MEKAGVSVGVPGASTGVHRLSTLAAADFTKKWLFRSTGHMGEV